MEINSSSTPYSPPRFRTTCGGGPIEMPPPLPGSSSSSYSPLRNTSMVMSPSPSSDADRSLSQQMDEVTSSGTSVLSTTDVSPQTNHDPVPFVLSRTVSSSSPDDVPPTTPCSRRNVLVLDLDETLVSYCPARKEVTLRPHLHSFLTFAVAHFDVCIFTASTSDYASTVLKVIDPNDVFNLQLYSREHCTKVREGQYVKDVSYLQRDLTSIVIIDDCPHSFLFTPRNGITVPPFFASAPRSDEDNVLLALIPLLKQLSKAPDVYPILDEHKNNVRRQHEEATALNASRILLWKSSTQKIICK
eukprot:PhF_6_TR12890/c0_g1_i1/m.20287